MAHLRSSSLNPLRSRVQSTSLSDPSKTTTPLADPLIPTYDPRTGPVLTDPISGPAPSIIPTAPSPTFSPTTAPAVGGGGPGSQEVVGWTPDGLPIIGYNPDGSPIIGTPAPAPTPTPAPTPSFTPRPRPGGGTTEEDATSELSPTEQAAQLLFGAVSGNPFITSEGRANLEQGLAPLLYQFNPAFWRYTSPTIIRALEGLFQSLGLNTNDLRFTIGSRTPTALRL